MSLVKSRGIRGNGDLYLMLAPVLTDINTYVGEMMTKFVTGGASLWENANTLTIAA